MTTREGPELAQKRPTFPFPRNNSNRKKIDSSTPEEVMFNCERFPKINFALFKWLSNPDRELIEGAISVIMGSTPKATEDPPSRGIEKMRVRNSPGFYDVQANLARVKYLLLTKLGQLQGCLFHQFQVDSATTTNLKKRDHPVAVFTFSNTWISRLRIDA
ncbi:hypothetical protein TNCV_998771 [Trichonephila clavipes]|nr:hypothetical protein TNCV_998771 [Trichonephila clavipes]